MAARGLNRAGELSQQPTAHELEYSTAMFCKDRIDNLEPNPAQPGERSLPPGVARSGRAFSNVRNDAVPGIARERDGDDRAGSMLRALALLGYDGASVW
jgi:hypothetical protein